ncbi:MAG: hypothetical protein Q7I92_08770, partial [Humidesulfovibrio sp.]|nr:hypothetical protein [Humidesulfovibrio sp.]
MTAYPHLKENITALQSANPALHAWLSNSSFDEESLKTNVFVNQWGLIDWRMPCGNGIFDAVAPVRLYHEWVDIEKADLSATVIV